MDRDPDPFDEFYRKHTWWVVHSAGRIVGKRDAEDVAQEGFVRLSLAYEQGQFDISKPALPYLRMATFWAARDHLRSLHGEGLMAQDEEIDPMDETLRGDPNRALAVRRAWDELDALLEAIPPERRIVW